MRHFRSKICTNLQTVSITNLVKLSNLPGALTAWLLIGSTRECANVDVSIDAVGDDFRGGLTDCKGGVTDFGAADMTGDGEDLGDGVGGLRGGVKGLRVG